MKHLDQDFDVIVMGGGISGMMTALRAAELQLKVLVLEQGAQEDYLCNTRLTSGVFHCAMQSASWEPKKLNEQIVKNTSAFADFELAQIVSSRALSSIRWLQAQGVRFIKGALPHYEYILSPPTLYHQNQGWKNKGGDVLLKVLERKLNFLGSQLLRGHKVIAIRQEQGDCCGVQARGPDGLTHELSAKHIVIADGGYQSNSTLLLQGISSHPEKLFQRNAKQSTGDGLLLAQNLGAQIDISQGFYGHLLSQDAFQNDALWPNPWMDPLASAGILVMKNGLRIADEGLGGIYLANQLARSNDPLDAFIIVDEITWNTRGRFNLQSPNPKLIEVGAKHHCAHSIEDLAHQAGIDPESLLKTVQSHNRAIDINDFTSLSPPRSPQPHHPMPIVGQRFFAFPVCAGITYTFGGIKTNANAQVMRPNGQIIPGLFAVGSCTTGLEGGATCGYVGGLIKSAVMGLQAAQTIHTLKHLS